MKKSGARNTGRSFLLCIFALAVMALASAEAEADEVFVSGFTDGCFGAGCVPLTTGSLETASRFALTYTNSQFAGTTFGGVFGIGSTSGGPFVQGNNNLGTFALEGSGELNYTGQRFTLSVTFTAPQGVVLTKTPTFSAMLTGAVTAGTAGGVFIEFDNTPRLFTFDDTNCGATTLGGGQQTTCGTGSFYFSVNNLAITPGSVVPLTGQITNARQVIVPEPATMLLFGTGLGVAAWARRRRATWRSPR